MCCKEHEISEPYTGGDVPLLPLKNVIRILVNLSTT